VDHLDGWRNGHRFRPGGRGNLGRLLLATASLLSVCRLSDLLARHPPFGYRGLAATVLLGSNYTFSAYATGGLETQLQTCLFTACAILSLDPGDWTKRRATTLGLLLAAAVLTRLTSEIISAVLLAVAAVAITRQSRPATVVLAMLLVPFVAAVGAWLGWKLWHYGSIVPHSAMVKLNDSAGLPRGFHYILTYVNSYWLRPAVGVVALGSTRAKLPLPTLSLTAAITLWVMYIVAVGGGFMEFRLVVAILPMASALIVWGSYRPAFPGAVRIALLAWLILGSLHHAVTFRYDPKHGIESVRSLEWHLRDPASNWSGIGKTLARALNEDQTVTIARQRREPSRSTQTCEPCLNDRWIRMHGQALSGVPGHRRIGMYDYLLQRGTNIVFSHPVVIPSGDAPAERPLPPGGEHLPTLEIPIDAEYKLIALYLRPHPSVEAAIRRHGWRVMASGPKDGHYTRSAGPEVSRLPLSGQSQSPTPSSAASRRGRLARERVARGTQDREREPAGVPGGRKGRLYAWHPTYSS
jgi:arabinofuranosyltransferase